MKRVRFSSQQASPLAEWLIERGIGEDRAILVEGEHVLAARLGWHGELTAGEIVNATLISRTRGSPRGTAKLAGDQEVLVDRLSKDASEGAAIRLEIKRSAISERGRLKLAQGRVTDKASETVGFAMTLGNEFPVREVRQFDTHLWEDIVDDALSGSIDFEGGSLLLAVTPAMVVIDIDGTLPARDLSLAAVGPIAQAIRQLDIGGMIGIDFPTLESKADRRAVDDALAISLESVPHERTAMNGFGFVQIVSRLERPSLLHRASHSRAGLLARQILRKAEHVAEPGALLLTIHPALNAKLKPAWLEELAKRSGREIRIEADPTLALESGFAQAVPL